MNSIKIDGVSIAAGNSKMGNIMHINLPPPMTCNTNLPCYKEGCYAMKFYRLRKNVKASWDSNWDALQQDRCRFFQIISDAVGLVKPKMFRWHSAGDIIDVNYMFRMEEIARDYPETKFMCFTKKHSLVYDFDQEMKGYGETPATQIILSAWPGIILPERLKREHPVAYMYDKKNEDPEIPETALPCGGGCEKCGVCWLMKPGQSVQFDRH